MAELDALSFPKKLISETFFKKNITIDKDTGPKYKILHIGAEVAPYSTVGGLSRVISYLSLAMVKRGHDVRIFMPKFGSIDEKKHGLSMEFKGLKVPTGHTKGNAKYPLYLSCNVKKGLMDNTIPVYFLENMEYYEKRSNVYAYSDDHIRWALLSFGALVYFCKHSDWIPDIIHVHDWHSALVPNILKSRFKKYDCLSNVTTVLSIHNMAFQGQEIDPTSEVNYDDGKSKIPGFYNEELKKKNYLKRGIIYSDVVSTVSEGYAREILTEQYGVGLNHLLLELRSKLFGIVNGIDYQKMNPLLDPLLETNFDVNSLDKRIDNKMKLQKEFSIEVDKNIPLFGYVGRVDSQKGVDLMLDVLDRFIRDFDVQFVLVGGGNLEYEKMAQKLAKKYPNRVGVHTYPNFTLPHLVFAGSDFMLFPSRFEPCGIVQLEAMRYGSIPVARATGGLDDTIDDFDPSTEEGNGFKYSAFDGYSLYGQMVRAIETYRNKEVWRKIQKNAMTTDFSWDSIALKYENLYKKAINFKKESLANGAFS